jgi:membrane protein implicated in regulation of membrane protease activity
VDPATHSILWWHWVALGLALIGAEIFIPSFTIVWFGAGAVLVGLALLAAPGMALWVQIFLWSVVSSVLTWAWFRYFKPMMADRTKSGMSQEAIVGETGMILRGSQTALERGRIRFPVPLLGDEEWDCISDDVLRTGDYARVIGIEGHVLRVERSAP